MEEKETKKEETKEMKKDIDEIQKDIDKIQESVKEVKQRSGFHVFLLTCAIILLFVAFALYGFASGIGYGVGKVKDSEAKETSEVNKSDTIHSYYFETKQNGTEKYFLTLGNMGKDDTTGYFNIRYVSIYETGSEAPLANGYYSIKDGTLKLTVGPYTKTGNEVFELTEGVFKKLGASLSVDPEQDWRKNDNPSYYNMYSTDYNENEITIGNQKFTKVG